MLTLTELGLILLVGLWLYGWYCHREARRSDLAVAFRRNDGHRARGSVAGTPNYRARRIWSLLAAGIVAGGVLGTAL